MVSDKLYYHYNACQIARKFIESRSSKNSLTNSCLLLCIFACNYFSIRRNICTFCNLITYVNTRAWNEQSWNRFLGIKMIPIKRDHHKGEWVYGKFMDTILFPIRARYSLHNLNLWILGKGIPFSLNPISWEKSISMFVYFVFQRSIKLMLIFIAIRF